VLGLEPALYRLVGPQLESMGHSVRIIGGADVGGVQMILFQPAAAAGSALRGFYRAGSDFRKDGQAAGW